MLHKSIYNTLINKPCMYLIFYKIYPLGHEIIISIKNQVIPFLNNISLSKDFRSFSDGLYNTRKIASRFILRRFCEGLGHKISHLNTCSIFLLMFSAGSDFWSGLLCSDQWESVFRIVLFHLPM